MPTFDFVCHKCDENFEFTRPFGSEQKPACPACGSKRTEKIIAPPAVHFKGGGWYKTDSRVPEPKAAEPEKKPEPPKPETKPKKETPPSAPAAKNPL